MGRDEIVALLSEIASEAGGRIAISCEPPERRTVVKIYGAYATLGAIRRLGEQQPRNATLHAMAALVGGWAHCVDDNDTLTLIVD